MKKFLVSDWRDCWKWISTHSFIAISILSAVYSAIPDDQKCTAAPGITKWIIGFSVLGLAGRLINQGLGELKARVKLGIRTRSTDKDKSQD